MPKVRNKYKARGHLMRLGLCAVFTRHYPFRKYDCASSILSPGFEGLQWVDAEEGLFLLVEVDRKTPAAPSRPRRLLSGWSCIPRRSCPPAYQSQLYLNSKSIGLSFSLYVLCTSCIHKRKLPGFHQVTKDLFRSFRESCIPLSEEVYLRSKELSLKWHNPDQCRVEKDRVRFGA